uniref:centrosomal protein of 78 kDa-like isoform X2 n=1 Tax=Myxine glutinosa TaxID=7769 RepID=UPI00358DEE95
MAARDGPRQPRNLGVQYEQQCVREGTAPLKEVIDGLESLQLHLNVDRLSRPRWPPVIKCIQMGKMLKDISFKSSQCAELHLSDVGILRRRAVEQPVENLRHMLPVLCKAIVECLDSSKALKSLSLEFLQLNLREIDALAGGLARSPSLCTLSLAGCPITDRGLEVLCRSLKIATTIQCVDFSNCGITWHGVEFLTKVIQTQAVNRHAQAWAESLRYRYPDLDVMPGLRRLSLNRNPRIADRGANVLADALPDELWLKALDLQACGISNFGADSLVAMLKSNSSIVVLDLRGNHLIGKRKLQKILKKVYYNSGGGNTEFKWLPVKVGPEAVVKKSRRAVKPLGCGGVKGRACIRIARTPGVSLSNRLDTTVNGRGTSHNTISKRVGMTKEGMDVQRKFDNSAGSAKRSEASQSYRGQLQKEREAREKAERKVSEMQAEIRRLREENGQLSTALLEQGMPGAEESLLHSVESSLSKFHSFLDLLEDVGLGQLAAVAGLHRDDISSLLESATGGQGGTRQLAEEGSLTTREEPRRSNAALLPGPKVPVSTWSLLPGC